MQRNAWKIIYSLVVCILLYFSVSKKFKLPFLYAQLIVQLFFFILFYQITLRVHYFKLDYLYAQHSYRVRIAILTMKPVFALLTAGSYNKRR